MNECARSQLRRLLQTGSVLAAIATAAAGPALGCACCPDPGYRQIQQVDLDEWQLAELLRLRLEGTAHMYTSPCGLDCVTGVAGPKEHYTAVLLKEGRSWKISLSHEDVDEGSLSFDLPESLDLFLSDPKPGSSRHTPILYTEERIALAVSGSGSFDTDGRATKGELILLGQQSSLCSDMAAFTHWMLQIDSPEARYRLFGRLAPALPP